MNLRTFALALLAVAFTTSAAAQATRTWVSGVGDDVNPCSRTAPCKTFAGAISKTAAGGEIDVLDPGGYGAVTITKSITIDGSGGSIAGIVVSGTSGIIVNAGATDVVILRNIHINGLAASIATPGIHGVNIFAAGEVHLEGLTIDGFNQEGVNFTPTGNAKLFVNNSAIRNNTGGGIRVAPGPAATASAYVNRTELIGNGRGLRAEDGSKVAVANSSAVGNGANGFVGLALAGRPVDLTIESSVSMDNGAIGVYAGSLATAKIGGTLITGNAGGIQAVDTGMIVSLGANRIYGNTGFNGPPSITIPQQ